MALYLNFSVRKFESNFMLLRNEQIKFSYANVPKNGSELLCGKRMTVLYTCNGPDNIVMSMFAESPTQGTYGEMALYTAKATKDQQIGVHDMCIKTVFAEYPDVITPVHRF